MALGEEKGSLCHDRFTSIKRGMKKAKLSFGPGMVSFFCYKKGDNRAGID